MTREHSIEQQLRDGFDGFDDDNDDDEYEEVDANEDIYDNIFVSQTSFDPSSMTWMFSGFVFPRPF